MTTPRTMSRRMGQAPNFQGDYNLPGAKPLRAYHMSLATFCAGQVQLRPMIGDIARCYVIVVGLAGCLVTSVITLSKKYVPPLAHYLTLMKLSLQVAENSCSVVLQGQTRLFRLDGFNKNVLDV